MYKTTRNLTALGIGLGVSALVGWLLLRENKRREDDTSVTVKSQRRQGTPAETPQIVLPLEPVDEDAETVDDLTEINDIGPRFAEALQAIGITRFEQLARQSPDELAERLNAHTTVRAQRIREKDWIGQAARLAQR